MSLHFANAMAVSNFFVLGSNPSRREKEPAADYRETVRAIGGRENDAGAGGVSGYFVGSSENLVGGREDRRSI